MPLRARLSAIIASCAANSTGGLRRFAPNPPYNSASIRPVQRRLAAHHPLHVLPGGAEQEGGGLPRHARDVGREQKARGGLSGFAREPQQRVVGGGGKGRGGFCGAPPGVGGGRRGGGAAWVASPGSRSSGLSGAGGSTE